ncbi:hypothetical protein E4T49_07044 [Aureobasidium sp. EXF-10728]|nr:hypothetical protein E4T49_07044 [Aureobasidium sp. EXF-10728]
MPTFWTKVKIFLCCGEEEEQTPALVIGEPFGFKRVDVDLAGLSEQEPVPVTVPITSDGASQTCRLDRARAHTRALSNSFKSATTNAMSSVGAKGSGYSALANGSASTMQPLRSEEDDNPHEMKELLPRSTGGLETSSSVGTAIAGCEEEDDGVKSFARIE